MGVVSLEVISRELALACRQLGSVVSETLASLVAATIVNAGGGSFYIENPLDEADARTIVEEAAKKILSKKEPGIASLQLQASYESAFSEVEMVAKKEKSDAHEAETRALKFIGGFTAKFDENFDNLVGLYKKIYQYLLLRCTAPWGVASPPQNEAIEREVAAALESVFPRVGLRAFVALTSSERVAQLQELTGIVLGIRLFNQHQHKGGVDLPTVDDAVAKLEKEDLLSSVQQEADELNDVCKAFTDVAVASRNPPPGGPWDKPPSEEEVEQIKADLLYHRQYLCYLLNLQEDLAGSMERLKKEQDDLREELIDLDALVGGRVSVPKEQVYPRFDGLAKSYCAAWQEIKALEARSKLHGVLSGLRVNYFPTLPPSAQEFLERVAQSQDAVLLHYDDNGEDPVDLDAIPGPAEETGEGAVRLTVDNSPDFLHLPLDFQGFCIHTLVAQGHLLVPGNPALGVVKYAGRYCAFATERACAEFCAEPDRYFTSIREVVYQRPELIHLLRIHDDFPKSSVVNIIQSAGGYQAPTQADMGTETPIHFQDSYIDENYEWNEWRLRREALHMADIKRKSTSATQTALSHLRRENESQVYLPKDAATNTTVNRGTNPPRWKKYHTGMRGEPQPMKVVEVKFDL